MSTNIYKLKIGNDKYRFINFKKVTSINHDICKMY